MKISLKKTYLSVFVLSFAFLFTAYSQGWKPELEKDSREALSTMISDAPNLKVYKDQAYAWAVFPKITKAAFVIGGAGGEGMVFRDGNPIATSKSKQGTFGLQAGGQQYSEVIFFQNKTAFEKFQNGNLKFNAQASAVAITPGASVDVAYDQGVAVFTRVKGGLMAEASLGGQHFSYVPVQ